MSDQNSRDQYLRPDQWWHSLYNCAPEVRDQMQLPPKVEIHDATLRDGEQTPGIVFDIADKIAIATKLDEIGVDRIEAGMPAVSEMDFEAIKQISKLGLKSRIYTFARAMNADIDKAAECGAHGVIVEVPIGYPKLKYQFKWTWEDVLRKSVDVINYAKKKGLHVVYFPYDTTRAREEDLENLLTRIVQDSNPDSVGVVDTMGCILPMAMKHMVKLVSKWTNGLPVEAHTHNDFGMAVATELAAVEAGAVCVHSCANGLGERTGNAALEELIVALHVLYGYETHYKLDKLPELGELVSRISKFPTAVNKPILGARNFTRESGIGVDLVVKEPLAMFGTHPSLTGRVGEVVLGKKSGKASITYNLEKLGMPVADDQAVGEMLKRVKDLGIAKRGILTDDEFQTIAEEVMGVRNKFSSPHMINPLLKPQFRIPFDQIRPEHIEPAVKELIALTEKRLDEIAEPKPRTYANTLGALDELSDELDFALGVVRHIESVATTPEHRAAFNAAEPLAAAFYSRVPLHAGVWIALKEFAETVEAKALTGVHKRFLEKTVRAFRKQGADLPPEKKVELEALDVELAGITTKFAEHVLDDTNAWEWVTTNEADLAGLPASARDQAKDSAAAKGKDGWRFTLQQPSYVAVLTYLDSSAIREKFYRAYQARASHGERDNRGLLVQIVELRRKKAAMLGYADFPDYALDERMAKTGATALAFLRNLEERTQPFFSKENTELEAFRRELEGTAAQPLQAWDIGYYAEKLRQARYNFDEEQLRPYFPLEKVLEGMFAIVGKLYGIRVEEERGVPTWDPAVKFYRILDASGEFLCGFYADWFPRENKRGGAWMDAFLTGRPRATGWEPHLGLMCGNLTPPSGGKPALLTHRDVETVFHEFGHLLHHALTRVEVHSLAGTNVAWDFVELPSQIMENWCWEREALDLFARHYETGAAIPEELFQKMVAARTFRSANGQMRQLSFGIVDLTMHREYVPARDGDPIDYSRKILQRFSAAPLPDDHATLNSFNHLFSSPVGYAAGYYSYKWAEVLDADAFSLFRKKGIFSAEAGKAFREGILAKGDSEDPAQLFRQLMGRDPDSTALFQRSGLVAS